jgi:hypothetical protein
VRAAVLHGHEDLRVEEVAEPVPAAGEVLVRVEAATTCGTDVKMWRRGGQEMGRQARLNQSSSSAFNRSGASIWIQWLAPSMRS